jgi:hypothetical protein
MFGRRCQQILGGIINSRADSPGREYKLMQVLSHNNTSAQKMWAEYNLLSFQTDTDFDFYYIGTTIWAD